MRLGCVPASTCASSLSALSHEVWRIARTTMVLAILTACPSGVIDEDPTPAEEDGGTTELVQSCTQADPDACDVGLDCCDEICVDTAAHPSHCGGCGISCGPVGFCATGTQCTEMRFANVCANDSFVVIYDGTVDDDLSSTQLQAALEERCPGNVVAVDETEPEILHPGTAQPLLAGGTTMVFAGGGFFQEAVAWLEEAGVTPVYFERSTGVVRFRAREDDRVLAEIAVAELTDSHDYFVVELATEPDFGALALIVYGFEGMGTRAGTWWFTNRVLPGEDPLRWYVGEWTDTDGDGAPSNGDTFNILQQWN